MSENTTPATHSAEMESVLRAWAHTQAPDRSFENERVFFFVQPVQHRDGVIFVPGELVLGHLAEGELAEQATARGLPRPLAIWSFELKKEVIIPPGLVRLEQRGQPPPQAAAPTAPK